MFHLPLELGPVDIDSFLDDGSTLRLGKEEIKVIHTPGHSMGGICFYVPASGFVLTGDTLFRGSIGRTDLPGGNQRQLILAIRSKLLTLPRETRVYPGHGPSSTIGEEAHSNPFL
jgi:glyoxylase-like metal-dependent hydrolase (beta-lactamase superfamily II)